MTATRELSVKRKADRAKMADILAASLRDAGAVVTVTDYANHVYPDGSRSSWTKRIGLEVVAPGGAHVGIALDGDTSQPDFFLCTWNTPSGVFINPAIGSVNPHHYSKATRTGYDLRDLERQLLNDITDFEDGTGYLPQSDPRIVQLRSDYHKRGWLWHEADGTRVPA